MSAPSTDSRITILRHLGETLAIATAGGAVLGLLGVPAGWLSGSILAVAGASLAGRPMLIPTLMMRAIFVLIGISLGAVVTPEKLADLARLRRARDLMDREYARPLDVAELARAALMSPAHFSRQFRAAYGETPYAYLMTRRIERAKALLRSDELSVTEVCLAVGCTSLGSFSARFTQVVGETPTAYRARNHADLVSVPGCIAKELTRPSRMPSRI